MKLREGYLMTRMGEDYVLVPTGEAANSFHGVARLNETAAFIVRQLQRDTDEAAILAAMLEEYEGTREQMAAGVEKTLAELRSIGALVE